MMHPGALHRPWCWYQPHAHPHNEPAYVPALPVSKDKDFIRSSCINFFNFYFLVTGHRLKVLQKFLMSSTEKTMVWSLPHRGGFPEEGYVTGYKWQTQYAQIQGTDGHLSPFPKVHFPPALIHTLSNAISSVQHPARWSEDRIWPSGLWRRYFSSFYLWTWKWGLWHFLCTCVCWHLMLLPGQNAEAALGRSQVLKGLNPQAELAEALLQSWQPKLHPGRTQQMSTEKF